MDAIADFKGRKEELIAQILRIQRLAIACYEVDVHCFTDYVPHVGQFSVRLYRGKWRVDADKEIICGAISLKARTEDFTMVNNIIDVLEGVLLEGRVDASGLEDGGENFNHKF